jgi:hypothetical protein
MLLKRIDGASLRRYPTLLVQTKIRRGSVKQQDSDSRKAAASLMRSSWSKHPEMA